MSSANIKQRALSLATKSLTCVGIETKWGPGESTLDLAMNSYDSEPENILYLSGNFQTSNQLNNGQKQRIDFKVFVKLAVTYTRAKALD